LDRISLRKDLKRMKEEGRLIKRPERGYNI
jgi:hypothetical protein